MKIAIAALAVVCAGPAAAQQAYQSPVYAINGPRIELRAGWDDPVIDATVTSGGTTSKGSSGVSGVGYGGEVGYDITTGGAMLGIYAGIDGTTAKDCSPVYGADSFCVRPGRNIAVGARVGYPVGVNSDVYLKGGYSNGQVRASYRDGFAADNLDGHDNFSGYHVGVGGELGLGRHAYTKLEYVYTHYSGYKLNEGSDSGSLDAHRHQVTAGFGFRL
ncbi:outer membrane protein [uncultured Sphingomonas sp.]|uniref:outer membrane protein n=1 Tax=uncultured Sphingomonas sp. TaxID=158754 RepID=UPI0035CB5A49